MSDVDSYTADGKTAIHLAVCNDNVAGLLRLLDCGADFQKTTPKGSTCLHMAACSSSLSTIVALAGTDGLLLDTAHINLAGSSASDVLDLNPNDTLELRVAFMQLEAALAGFSILPRDGERQELFEDAAPYQ